ncbi:MAG: DNA polymerase III subunit gamma/tau [Candidatus Pacebacteria bacterium]|nr:DNA polymerase III subunit gamma/tau [Candidatus Paceibacterota bacterium]
MNWNRKYRPARVADLHLVSVRNELLTMLHSGSIPQALLFAGPKGTGKTTAARILAAVLNGDKELSDITEISAEQAKILAGNSFLVRELDAASNRGIDDIRQLKEAAFTPPPIGEKSVYILDEAHMLTTEAWNALLKLLEEPPEHAVFILATTELQKIPGTIRSRCREVFFSQASTSEIAAALGKVVASEKLSLQKPVIEQIADAAGGSFRDGIKLLEQIAAQENQDLSHVADILGKQTTADYTKLLALIIAKVPQDILQFFDELRANTTDEQAFLKGFLGFLHDQLVLSYTHETKAVASQTILRYLLTQLQLIAIGAHSPLPHLALELALLNMIAKSSTQREGTPPVTPKKSKPPQFQAATISNHTGNAKKVCEKWEDILVACTERNFGLATLLRSAKAIAPAESALEIQVYYDFHREQLLLPKFYTVLCEVIEQISGGSLLLSVTTTTVPNDAELLEVGQTPLKQLAVDALM